MVAATHPSMSASELLDAKVKATQLRYFGSFYGNEVSTSMYITLATLGWVIGTSALAALHASQAILSQAICGASFKPRLQFENLLGELAGLIGWQTMDASILRARAHEGEFTVPIVIGLLWSSIAVCKSTSRVETRDLEGPLGSVVNMTHGYHSYNYYWVVVAVAVVAAVVVAVVIVVAAVVVVAVVVAVVAVTVVDVALMVADTVADCCYFAPLH